MHRVLISLESHSHQQLDRDWQVALLAMIIYREETSSKKMDVSPGVKGRTSKFDIEEQGELEGCEPKFQ